MRYHQSTPLPVVLIILVKLSENGEAWFATLFLHDLNSSFIKYKFSLSYGVAN
jgi:hypothetical protein